MASCSFDGSLRVWDLRSNSLKAMFEDRNAQARDKTLQCIAWYNPAKVSSDLDPCRNLIVIGTAAGRIKLVDIEKNRVIWKEDLGDKNVLYDVDWGQNGMLAIGGVNKELCLRKFDKTTQSFAKHKNVAI